MMTPTQKRIAYAVGNLEDAAELYTKAKGDRESARAALLSAALKYAVAAVSLTDERERMKVIPGGKK